MANTKSTIEFTPNVSVSNSLKKINKKERSLLNIENKFNN